MHVYILHTRIYCMYMHVDACRCICICMWICMYIYSIHVIDCMYMHVDACICMWLYACIYYMHRSTKYQQTYIGLGRCWGACNLELFFQIQNLGPQCPPRVHAISRDGDCGMATRSVCKPRTACCSKHAKRISRLIAEHLQASRLLVACANRRDQRRTSVRERINGTIAADGERVCDFLRRPSHADAGAAWDCQLMITI